MIYDWHMRCPRCGKTSAYITEDKKPVGRFNCGECLIKHTEIVELEISCVLVNDEEEGSGM